MTTAEKEDIEDAHPHLHLTKEGEDIISTAGAIIGLLLHQNLSPLRIREDKERSTEEMRESIVDITHHHLRNNYRKGKEMKGEEDVHHQVLQNLQKRESKR